MAERFATYEHPEAHFVAISERGFGGDGVAAEHDVDEDNDAIFAVSRRAAHGATVVDGAFDYRVVLG